MQVIGLLALFAMMWFVFYTLLIIVRAVIAVLTFDVFGIYYDDPKSPYYHDRRGQGRGQ
jgi:hypothetical protein